MKISKEYFADDWCKLKLNENIEEDWQKAIDILEARLTERFLEPVDILINAEESEDAHEKKFGFTILAIDLLLMETLQAFKEGLETTERKSKQTFTNFLRDSPHFSKYFTTDELREKFYKEFRCGILHQAEVQSDEARVWSVGELYKDYGSFYTVNRTKIHENLKKDFEDYIKKLRDTNSKEERKLFKKKMDAIARKNDKSKLFI